MLRWMGASRAKERHQVTTEDPLAALDPNRKDQGIYSVSRVNPLFVDTYRGGEKSTHLHPAIKQPSSRQSTPSAGEKSSSSGYGGSHGYSSGEATYAEMQAGSKAPEEDDDDGVVMATGKLKTKRNNNKLSHSSGSSGTLTTIPEGHIDFTIPRPIWPNKHQRKQHQDYDSLVDEAVLLYTSLSQNNHAASAAANGVGDTSVRDILVDLFNSINATMEGKGKLTPEEMLKKVNEKISLSLEALKDASEEEMRLLCVNLRNSHQVNSVMRAFSNSSTSGNSSQSSPEWSCSIRNSRSTSNSDNDDIYQSPSGSSSSGFSDTKLFENNNNNASNPSATSTNGLPVFVHEDLASVPNNLRNAMIYGTLCRNNNKSAVSAKSPGGEDSIKKQSVGTLLRIDDEKPSVWEQYYGVNVLENQPMALDVMANYVPKPTDVPIYPGGRPEADFTLDLPRSEMLSKRMKEDKKWRCRCRLLTTFLGLVFFLLSVMAVSLMLTRGRRMFGSMV